MIKNSAIQIIIILISLIGLNGISSCHHNTKAEIKMPRDTTITIANAYSQFLIDSTALESFVGTEVTSDSIANYMRNFYNSRNYTSSRTFI